MNDRVFHAAGGESAQDVRAEEPTARPISTLDMLREAVDVREQAPVPEPVAVAVPGLGMRLLCDPDFSYAQYRDWQKAGLPDRERTGKKAPNALSMDRAATATLVLVNTCVGVELEKADGGWMAVHNSKGEPVTLKDSEFLTTFNMIDPKSLVRKLFTPPGLSPDAPLIKACDLVVNAAGYGEEEEGDEGDPTD